MSFPLLQIEIHAGICIFQTQQYMLTLCKVMFIPFIHTLLPEIPLEILL